MAHPQWDQASGRAPILAAFFLAVAALSGQVKPLPIPKPPPAGQPPPGTVLPGPKQQPGSVTPLPLAPQDPGTEVFAVGTATVFGGNVAAARQAALQAAYAEAVARGSGVDVGRFTLVRDVKAVSDIVATRSRGFIRSYEIIGEGLVPDTPPRIEVRIRAVVSTEEAGSAAELEGLRLFLEVIGTPTLLILLPDAEVPEQIETARLRVDAARGGVGVERRTETANKEPTPGLTALGADAQMEGTLRAAEAAVAQAFSSYGYRVLTSDDLISTGLATEKQLAEAKKGVTSAATVVAKAAGADLLLTGILRISTQRVSPQGVDFVSATTAASAKAMLVSNGATIDAYHRTVTKAHPSTIGAVSMTMQTVADELASALAWKIPSILSSRPRVTHLEIEGVTLELAQQLRDAIQQLDGISAVRFATIPTARKPSADLEILSGYVTIPAEQLADRCNEVIRAGCRIDHVDKFRMLVTIGTK